MTREELQSQCDSLTVLYGIEPHSVEVNRRILTGGDCTVQWRQIRISVHMDDFEQQETLRHELAHALAYKRSKCACHCEDWIECARLLGARTQARSAPLTAALIARERRRK